MAIEILGAMLAEVVPDQLISGALLAAGLCFSFVYLATLATILACHYDEM